MSHRHTSIVVVTATVLLATVLSGIAPATGASSPPRQDTTSSRGPAGGTFGERTVSLDAGRHGAIAMHLPGKRTDRRATPGAARYQGAGFSLH